MPIFATNTGTFSPLSVKGIHATGSVADFLIQNSLKFDKESSSTLTRSITTTGSQTKFTLSCWIKPSHDYDYTYLIGVSSSFSLYFTNTRKLHAEMYSPDGSTWAVISDTQATFSDVAAWYHVVATVDSSAGTTNADRFKIWVNGVQQTIDFTTYWAGLIDGNIKHLNESGQTHQINSRPGATYYSSFYLAEYHYLDGFSVTSPTDFGEFDATTGIWTPIQYTGQSATTGPWGGFSRGATSSGDTHSTNGNADRLKIDTGVLGDYDITITKSGGANEIYLESSPDNSSGSYSLIENNITTVTLTNTGTPSHTYDRWVQIQGSGGGNVTVTITGTAYGGLNVGPNGVHLNFSNSSDVGEDQQAGSNDFTASGIAFGYGDATITTFEGNQTNLTTPVTSTTGPDGYSHYAFFNLTNNSGQHIFYHQANNATSTWFFSDSGHSYQGTHSTQQGGNTLGYRNDGSGYENHVSTWGTFATANGTTSGYAYTSPTPGGIDDGTVTGLNTTNAVNVWKFVVDMTNHKVWIDPGTGSYAGGGDPTNTSSTATFEIPDADLKFWSVPYASTSTNTIYSGSDIMKDSPMSGDASADTGLGGQLSSNYATLNPLNAHIINTSALSDGNLKISATAFNSFIDAQSTIPASEFDCYCEVTVTAGGGAALQGIGVGDITATIATGVGSYVVYREGGDIIQYPGNTTVANVASYTTGDVLGMTITSTQVAFYKNGSLQGTYNHSLTGDFFACGMSYHNGNTSILDFNFGQQSFQHPAPSGFKCLCAANLPDSAISDGTTALSIVEWDGVDGTADTVSGLNLVNDPGFIWTKATNHGYHNNLWDIVRGYNLTNALITDYNGSAGGGKITSVTPSSFSHDGGVWFNENTRKYVAWAFDAGSTTSTIAAGGSNNIAYEQGAAYNSQVTGTSQSYDFGGGGLRGDGYMFDGDIKHSTAALTSPNTIVWSGSISFTTSFAIASDNDGVANAINITHGPNNTVTNVRSQVPNTANTQIAAGTIPITTLKGITSPVTQIELVAGGSGANGLCAVVADGKILVDNTITPTNVPERECKVRANQTSGFSVVRVDDPNNTEGRVHGLTKAPEFIMAKATATLSENWHTFHVAFGKSRYGIFGPSGTNAYNSSDQWGSREPNDSTFYVKPLTGSGANYAGGMIYYIWHSVPGFSKFGSFEGTDLDPGPFVYLGFKPALIILKNGDATGDWIMHDSTRSPYNEAYAFLRPNSSAAENTTANNQSIDILSNGFRIKAATSTNDAINGPSNTITYCAWAENPFKGSLAV